MDYKCGHKHKSVSYTKLDRDIFLEWKYTNGFEGDSSLCYECWKSKRGKSSDKE